MKPRILPAGEACLFVEFGSDISRETNSRVAALKAALEADMPPGVTELVPTYRSLAVYFDPRAVDVAPLRETLARAAARASAGAPVGGTAVRVPVCFGGEFGPDLPDVAALRGVGEDEVVRRFCASPLYCYMNGFMPGFPYLGGLDASLATPRLKTPRPLIPAGSVAIGGEQAGAYPFASPGGWRVIGRIPFPLYDAGRDPRAAVRAGMDVRFYPVSRERWDRIAQSAREGTYRVEYETEAGA